MFFPTQTIDEPYEDLDLSTTPPGATLGCIILLPYSVAY